MIDIGEFLTDYLTRGFYHFNAEKVLSSFDITAFEPIKKTDATFHTDDPEERYRPYTHVQGTFLKQLSAYMSETYFKGLNHELRFNDMWATANPNTYGWHCDTMRCWPGFNSSINCYFDDTEELTGGAFQSHPGMGYDITHTVDLVSTVYPKSGDIIIINQSPVFKHRVTPSTIQRRMVSFSGAFFDFNPI